MIKLLENECKKRNIITLDLPQYYYLDDKQKNIYSKCFSNESLFIRSHPDKLLLGKFTVFIDCKTKQKKHKENIAIELSSFYWALKYNLIGLNYYYIHYNTENIPMIFRPHKNEPHTFMIQPRWNNHPIGDIFKKYISEIKNIFNNDEIHVQVCETRGSQDPFVLIRLDSLEEIPLVYFLDSLKIN